MSSVNKCYWTCSLLVVLLLCEGTKQDCPMEISPKAISVKWNASPDAVNILSDPICYSYTNELITRNCTDGLWSPPIHLLNPCVKVINHYDINSCPPGYYKILENNTDYCYQLTQSTEWDYPCFKSGGASTITDLSSEEVNALLDSLHQMNVSQYYWLPARRQKLFNPVVWTIPGPNWFIEVRGRPTIPIKTSMLKNCLLLDVTNRIITTEKCANAYPSLCFYINNVHYPASCPPNYQAFRFMLDDGICFGVEYSDNINGSAYEEFLSSKCKKPMGNNKRMEMTRFLYKKMASTMFDLQDSEWCWFGSFEETTNAMQYSKAVETDDNDNVQTDILKKPFQGVINKNATLGLMHETTPLPCMACEKEISYGESEFVLEYNSNTNKIYLTVYLPSGLWKYDDNDTGVRCFSNALGFVHAVSINEITHVEYSEILKSDEEDEIFIDKIQYEIDPISTRMAQYWCEGHTKKFSLITSDKVIANPHGDSEHVFALIAKIYNIEQCDLAEKLNNVSNIISEVFNAQKSVLMDILNFTTENAIIVMHVHVTVNKTSNENEKQLLLELYRDLENIATTNLPIHDIDFINLSSSIYCFPITTQDIVTLEWDFTEIGQIAAPNQFCLQVNGLPVKRRCGGSYMLGAEWEPVEGRCDSNYKPSNTTNFLYRFVKGLGPQYWTENFMTEGLKYVLDDVDIIIPADIYYLSESFKQITSAAQANRSSLDMGDLENMAWTVDRLMVLNYNYLNLAQTLNSTNVILDSITDLIEILAVTNNAHIYRKDVDDYQLAVKPQFLTQITFPQNNNITGIALIKTTDSDLFTDLIIQPLYKNTSLEYIMEINDLELATWLPDDVFEYISQNENSTIDDEDSRAGMHILINVFYNDAIFQEIDLASKNKNCINSRIVEVTIPGYNISPEFTIPLIFKAINNSGTRNYCGFWSFQTGDRNGFLGQWKRRGCVLVTITNNMVVCKCYHLTHFAQLITWQRHGEQEDRITPEHTRALNIITLFGSFLSLLGIAGIWITAMVFSMWRQKAGTKVLLQLSAAIALPLILMIYFSLDTNIFTLHDDVFVIVDHMRGFCIGLGALLHYSILAGFVWMLITAILQFVRYVRVLGVKRPSRFMIKMSIVGWGLPTIPVTSVLLINRNTYIPVDSASYHTPICYPNGIYFVVAVLLPVGVITIVNVVLFLCVMVSIARGPDGKVRTPDLDLVKAQLRLSIFLFFLLGLTWIFGIFSFSKNYIWSYLFCLTSTMQGFVLFLYFVICDPATRNLWITLMMPQFRTTGSRASISSINSSNGS